MQFSILSVKKHHKSKDLFSLGPSDHYFTDFCLGDIRTQLMYYCEQYLIFN